MKQMQQAIRHRTAYTSVRSILIESVHAYRYLLRLMEIEPVAAQPSWLIWSSVTTRSTFSVSLLIR